MPRARPNLIDRKIGLRIRQARKECGLTQQALADAIGVTFQQIQKYENAKNRIPASRLYQIAEELEVAIEWFF